MMSDVSICLILPPAPWPYGWLSLWQKRVPEIFLEVKGSGSLPLHKADITTILSADGLENV
jgi:hypothetical protein